MLVVNTSVAGAFGQLHHSPFLTDRITFSDVPPFPSKSTKHELTDAEYISKFPALCWIFLHDLQTILPETLLPNNQPRRPRPSLQLRRRFASWPAHSLPRRSPTNRAVLVREQRTAILDMVLSFGCNGRVVDTLDSVLQYRGVPFTRRS